MFLSMYSNIVYNCISRKFSLIKALLQKFSASFGKTGRVNNKQSPGVVRITYLTLAENQ